MNGAIDKFLVKGLSPQKHAQIGEFHLEEAILTIIHQAGGRCLGPRKITQETGIYTRGQRPNEAVVSDYLYKMEKENRVEHGKQPNGRPGWRLTREEEENR